MKNITQKPASLFPDDDETVLVSKPSDRPEILSTSCYGILKEIIKWNFLVTD